MKSPEEKRRSGIGLAIAGGLLIGAALVASMPAEKREALFRTICEAFKISVLKKGRNIEEMNIAELEQLRKDFELSGNHQWVRRCELLMAIKGFRKPPEKLIGP